MTTSVALTAVEAAPSRHPGPSARRRRILALWNLGAVCAVWGTSLYVVALWVAGGGVDAVVTGTAEALQSLGRLTGLVAANLLLYQVLLMARVPLFERGFGRVALTRMHRLVGFWSLWLMCAHIVLLVFGYAIAAGVGPWTQLWQFVWDYPGMLLATAASLLIVMVAITSIRRARRRLKYESWHLLHLYAYIGVGLAVPHQLWAGADFTASPAATVYWWLLWAAAAAAVIAYRVVLPVVRSLRADLRVAAVEPDGSGGVTVRVRGRHSRGIRAQSGQFFIWRFLDGPGWTRGHPFSLSAAPREGELALTASIVGDGTARLARVRPGSRVLVEGPFGHFTGDVRTGRRLVLIGAGAGVAPLVSLLEGEPYAPGDAVLITRDSGRGAPILAAAVSRLVAERGILHIPLSGPRGAKGWLPGSHAAWRGADALVHLLPDIAERDAYVCGPQAWMDAVVADLRAAGVPSARIQTESFAV
ncbi:ferric reductase-like transmembrane domain-containing protein [Microbacterium sp. NPDC012755]|uniref:ferredoxin reductase family protein n=1 Tax=Microbacterium sp. NPDC012755 TaxID=3364184 RepID=UPI00368E30D3